MLSESSERRFQKENEPVFENSEQPEGIMINNDKVKLMTKLAVYEEKQGKEDMSVANYFKSDYLSYQILKTVLAVTFGCIFILAMVIAYNMDYLMDKVLILNYAYIGKWILVIYLLLIVVYVAVTWCGYRIKYMRSHERLAKYYKLLGKLRRMEEKEERMKDMEDEWEE